MPLSDQFAQAYFERLSFNSPLNCSASTLCPSNSLGWAEVSEELADAKLKKIIQFKIYFDVWRICAIIQVTSFHGLFLRHVFVLPANSRYLLKEASPSHSNISATSYMIDIKIYSDLIQMKSDCEVSKRYKRNKFWCHVQLHWIYSIFLPVFIIIILNRHD